MEDIDFGAIKAQLNEDHIISIMASLDVPFVKQDGKQIIFYSVCHHPGDFMQHKPKLYYYIDTKSFYCFACGWSGDIFALVRKVNNMTLRNAVSFVCDLCSIQIESKSDQESIDNWQVMKRYLPGNESKEPLKIYNSNVLKLFDNTPHQSWLDDGISVAAMQKFHIGWYARNEQITIPVFDIDGNLVGIHGRNTRQYLVDKGLKYQPVKTLNDEYRFPTGQVLYGLFENQSTIQGNEATIFEAPKSVLQSEDIMEQNSAIALFGWNMQSFRRDMLLELGINSVNIALDKQYHSINSQEFEIYAAHVKKIVKLFKPYCAVYVIWDRQGLLEYKDSPSDKGVNIWRMLYQQRQKI